MLQECSRFLFSCARYFFLIAFFAYQWLHILISLPNVLTSLVVEYNMSMCNSWASIIVMCFYRYDNCLIFKPLKYFLIDVSL
uniref:Uncharacterized protein n=1 Tax=Arundo donax TaxID=35708 RepID=A0A0A9G953_ARUDO